MGEVSAKRTEGVIAKALAGSHKRLAASHTAKPPPGSLRSTTLPIEGREGAKSARRYAAVAKNPPHGYIAL